VRYEEAIIDIAASQARDLDAIAVLAAACQSRRTTAQRLLAGLRERPTLPKRAWLIGVLHDVAGGSCSVLEHAYLTNVEQAHGLSAGVRQARELAPAGVVYRDVLYDTTGVVVELDGRLFHDSVEHRDRDLDRDLDAAIEGRVTIRLSYGQVLDRGCVTAARVARLLVERGWTGRPQPCGSTCPVEGEVCGLGPTG